MTTERDFSRQSKLVSQAVLGALNIDVIGVGAVGHNLARNLAIMGAGEVRLFDPDRVDLVNVTNQGYELGDVGDPKVSVTREKMRGVNPDVELVAFEYEHNAEEHGFNNVVFVCVDSLETRRKLWEAFEATIQGRSDFLYVDTRMVKWYFRVLSMYRGQTSHYAKTFGDEEGELFEGACGDKGTIALTQMAGNVALASLINWMNGTPMHKDLRGNMQDCTLVHG